MNSHLKEQRMALINFITSNNNIKKFKYYDIFFKKYKKLLTQYSTKNIHYIVNNLTDFDQCFHYDYRLFNTNLEFNFYIPYIRRIYNLDKKYFAPVKIINEKGELKIQNYNCYYTHYEIEECDNNYPDIEEIFVIMFPNIEPYFIVVDGNHRVSLQINEETINAIICPHFMIEHTLSSAFEVILYSCVFDCSFILYNQGRIPDLEIKKRMKIFNSKELVNNLDNRGTLQVNPV